MPGNTAVGLSFDTTSIKQADEAIKRLVKNAESGIGKVNKAWKDMTKDGLNHFIQRLSVAQRAMSQLSNARVNVRFSGQASDLKKLGDSAIRAIPQVNKLITAMQQLSRLNINIVGSRGGGSTTAMDAQKVKYLQDQIQLLEKQLKLQQDISKALGNQVKGTNNVKNSMGGLEDAARKIRKISSTIFSIRALMGYGNQLLQIRGEFEMQHRSLQVLLGDIDKANELWNKTVDLAVKSPFRVKELVTYTKQLAAYRVEADKLYETNRMLADVSAGLGVDMNRLILAFGQVKAANFLRGTELRQFSEAGVNMLEELAKRFTQLEGRAVSVGDVFERVSKRMVSFADVEAVFQTITSEGGTFYKMQEKQSETLRGMMMNLKDSIDIMFNEIGISSDSALKRAIKTAKELVDNWRDMIPVLKAVGVAMAFGFSTKGILTLIRAFVVLNKRIKETGVAISLLKSANVWSLLVAAVAGFITYLIAAKKNVNELTAAMNNIDISNTRQLEESITLYRTLAEKVKDVTSTEKDREKAMGQLKSRFDEILPDQLLELEYIKGISDNYEEATNAMMNYYNAKATEQKRDRVDSLYGEKIEGENVPDLIRAIRKRIESVDSVDERLKQVLFSGVSGAVNEVVEDIKNGKIDASAETLLSEIENKLGKYAGISKFNLFKNVEGYYTISEALLSEEIRKTTGSLVEYKNALEGIMGLPFRTYAEKEAASIFNPEKANIAAVKNTFREVLNLVSEYSNIAANEWTELDARFNAIVGKLPEEAASYLPLLYDMLEKMKLVVASAKEGGASFDFGKSIQGFQQEFTQGLANVLWEQTGEKMFDPINANVHNELVQLVTNMDNTLRDEAAKLNLTDFQESVVNAMEVIAKSTKVNVNEFSKFIPKISDSLTTTREAIEGEISLLKGDIERWNNSLKATPPESIAAPDLNKQREGALGLTQEQVDSYKELVTAYEMLWRFLGGGDKEKRTGRTDTIDERIRVIDQMNAKYKELNKTLSSAESLKGAFEAYKDAFAIAYGRKDVRDMSAEDFAKNVLNFPNEDEVVKWLDNLEKKVSDKEDKIRVQLAKGKFEMDVRVRHSKEEDKKVLDEIQRIFDRYDLTLDLKKLNIPSDLAKSLFNVEYMSFEEMREKIVENFAEGSKEAQEELRKGLIGADWTKLTSILGEDQVNEARNALQKIDNIRKKQEEEEARRFVNFLKKQLDEVRVILAQKGIDISYAKKQFDSGAISAQTFAEVVREISKQANEDISKINFEKFKESTLYIKAMGNLAAYSKEELSKMTKALSDALAQNAKNMSVDELEAYHKALERIRKEQEKFEPFVKENEIRKMMELIELEKELAKEEETKKGLQGEKSRLEVQRASLINLIEKAKEDTTNGQVKSTQNLQNQLLKTEEGIQQVDSLLANSEMSISNISGQIGNITGGAMGAIAMIDMIVQAVNDTCNAAKKTFEDIMEMADSFGVETDKGSWREASHFFEGMSNFNAEVTEGWENLKSGNLMGAIANTIGSIVGFIRDVNKWKDSNAEEYIQDQLKDIEDLEREYERLEWAIGRAFSFDKYGRVAEQTKNLGRQVEALKNALAAEEGKKDTDPERIQELKDNIESASQEIQELYDNLRADIVGTFEDMSTTLGEAMINALKEGEDAIVAWGEEVDNIIQDIVSKLLIQKFLEPKIADLVDSYYAQIMPKSAIAERKYQEYVEAMDKGDRTKADQLLQEYLKLNEKAINEVPQISEDATKQFQEGLNATGDWFLNIIPDWFKDMISSSQGGGLSALQKGIQGITEQTAQVLEAYLNSVRMYVATISADTTSQLNEVRAIHRLLDSVTTGGHSRGGVGFKVFMD